jgi:hypothetical protein
MPTFRRATLDLFNFDGALTLNLDAGVAAIDLTQVSFIDAYALTGLACIIASAVGDGLPVELYLPERYDVRSWLARMHLGDVFDVFEVRVDGSLPRVAERDRRDNLIELERFGDSHGSDRLASFIWERLQGGADSEVVNQLYEGNWGAGSERRRPRRLTGRWVRRGPALQGRDAGGMDHRGGRGRRDRHPRVAPHQIRCHDRRRGDLARDPVVCVSRPRPGPRAGALWCCGRRQEPRRDCLYPQR